MTVVCHSPVWWRKDTWSILPVFIVCVVPLPRVDISARSGFMAVRVAVAILSDACCSVLRDIVLFALFILDVVMDHGPLEGASRR